MSESESAAIEAPGPTAAAPAPCRPRAKQKLSAAQAMAKEKAAHQRLRIAIQIVFFLLAPGLFAAAFNGVKYLFTQIGLLQSFEAVSFLIVLLALLAFTIVFGRFFCGYACAFGALGDWLYKITQGVLAKTPIGAIAIPEKVVRRLSPLKYVIAGAIALACAVGVWAGLSGYSPWVAFAALTSGSLEGISAVAIGLLIACAVAMALSERFFCRVLCPMGAVFALMPVLPFSSFARTRSHCAGKCGKCRDACPVGIWPDPSTLAGGECIACGRCASTCPLSNVNLVAIAKQPVEEGSGRPVRKTADSWFLVKGSKAPSVLAKAAVLFVICWMLGLVRFLPSFTELTGIVYPF